MKSRPCAKHKRYVSQCAACVKKRETAQRASARAHSKRVEDTYGITAEEYAAILEAQGGVCYICHKPPKSKRLAVDHDHDEEAALLAMGYEPLDARRASVRGLLCRNDNYHVLGQLDREALQRAIDYLKRPPARFLLA